MLKYLEDVHRLCTNTVPSYINGFNVVASIGALEPIPHRDGEVTFYEDVFICYQ